MLWEKTGEKPMELQIKKRKWKWIGHTVRKDQNAVERIVLDWNPQGTRKRGRPKTQGTIGIDDDDDDDDDVAHSKSRSAIVFTSR
jgi:hypothetical protein